MSRSLRRRMVDDLSETVNNFIYAKGRNGTDRRFPSESRETSIEIRMNEKQRGTLALVKCKFYTRLSRYSQACR